MSPGHNTDGHLIAGALTAPRTGSGGSYRLDAHDVDTHHLVAPSNHFEATGAVGTLNATKDKGGWRIGADEAAAGQLVAHTLRSEGFDASEDGTGRGTPLTTFDAEFSNHGVHGVADESGSLTRKLRKAVHGDGAVRRLTPTECERLQGLPDGWTIPHGPSLLADLPRPLGETVPFDPKPDGPRYAACGDAVTANVAEWIGRRLMADETPSLPEPQGVGHNKKEQGCR